MPKLRRSETTRQIGAESVDGLIESSGFSIENLSVETRFGRGRNVVQALVEVVPEFGYLVAEAGRA